VEKSFGFCGWGCCALLLWGFTVYAQAGPLHLEVAPPELDLKELSDLVLMTQHHNGRPRDPVNVALVGDRWEVARAMTRAGWVPAKPHSMKCLLKEVACILEHRSYPDAPVSHSFLYDRREDMAFESQVGGSPKKRHHIRFWETPFRLRGVPVWAGAATYDRGVKLFKFDHKVEKNVDVERDYIVETLKKNGTVLNVRYIPGWDSAQLKKNCGFVSDGKVALADLWPGVYPEEKRGLR